MALVFAALWGSGCGSSTPRLDATGIERAIETAIRHERGVDLTVKCPSPKRRAGEVFDCVATAPKALPTYFEVTETDGAGHIHFLGLS